MPMVFPIRAVSGHRYVAPKTGTAFDLTGDLSAVPNGYLYVVARRGNTKPELARRCAQELRRRGVQSRTLSMVAGGPCCLCDRVGLYIVGRTVYCRRHKDQATAARGLRSAILDRRDALRSAAVKLEDRGRRSSELHKAAERQSRGRPKDRRS